MKTIGLLGGMSWESTAEYYRLLNEGVRDRLGGLHSARIVLTSVDFAEIERMQVEERWNDAASALADEARRLETADVDVILLCTNTMHKVADVIESAVDVTFLHLADATAEAIVRSDVSTVGLLGTTFTMEQAFYRERLETKGIHVIVPAADDRALVHRVIYDELCIGVVREESRVAYADVIDRLIASGAEGIVLGCTEIELLVNPDETWQVPMFPTTRIHVEAAIEYALAYRHSSRCFEKKRSGF